MTSSSPFAGVHPRLIDAISRRGFSDLTAVQRAVLGSESAGRDLRISSETGSGKTLALGFLLAPSLVESKPSSTGPTALVIAPTRELASQVRDELAWLYEDVSDVQVVSVTGGTEIRREQKQLAQRPALLVGTPGRLLDHIRSGALDCGGTTHVVLDEADQMLDMGFRDELDAIVKQLPEERHSHLVSATFPDQVRRMADAFQNEPLRLEGTRLGAANADISHVVHVVRPDQRYAAIVNTLLLAQGERCLIFVRKRVDAAKVAEMLSGDGFSALPLSGDLAQAQRTRTLNAFRSGTIRALVATDVAARGIDVADISVVIQGDLPEDSDVYTHRSGRTGRAGQLGRCVLLCTPPAVRRVEHMLRQANVEASFLPVPSAGKIRKAVRKQVRRELNAKLKLEDEEGQAPEAEQAPKAEQGESQLELRAADLEYAQALMKEVSPERVIATLLRMAEPELQCEPTVITPPAKRPASSGRKGDPRQRPEGNSASSRRAPRAPFMGSSPRRSRRER